MVFIAIKHRLPLSVSTCLNDTLPLTVLPLVRVLHTVCITVIIFLFQYESYDHWRGPTPLVGNHPFILRHILAQWGKTTIEILVTPIDCMSVTTPHNIPWSDSFLLNCSYLNQTKSLSTNAKWQYFMTF